MSKISTNVRVDEQLKEKSVAILEELGFTLSSAVNIFLRQVVLNKGLPFEIIMYSKKKEDGKQ